MVSRVSQTVCAVVVAALLVPATAAAGTVTAGTFTAAPGEKNDVRYDAFGAPPITVVDLGAPLIVGAGCTAGTPVTCEFSSGVTLHLGDRADRGSASAVIAAVVYGEQGDDVIQADAEQPVAYGGPGDDQIRLSGNGLLGLGGRGDDRIEGPFQSAVGMRFSGEEGDDTLVARAGAGRCTLEGGRGADRLLSFSCTQLGGPGDDVMTRSVSLSAGGVMNGDAGNDVIVGGLAADTIDGGPGGDFIQAAADGVADTIVCGTGNDIVRANAVDSVAADCEIVTRVEPPAP